MKDMITVVFKNRTKKLYHYQRDMGMSNYYNYSPTELRAGCARVGLDWNNDIVSIWGDPLPGKTKNVIVINYFDGTELNIDQIDIGLAKDTMYPEWAIYARLHECGVKDYGIVRMDVKVVQNV